MEKVKHRLYVLDTIRGILMIDMLVYHTLWDLVYLFGVSIPWFAGKAGVIWSLLGSPGFIILSGFCFGLGHKHLRRGITLIICGGIITAVTLFVLPQSPIYFGILTFMGACMLLLTPIEKLLYRVNKYIGITVSALLYVCTFDIQRGRILFFDLPQRLYSNMLTTALGFPMHGFNSADYFPLIPGIFLYLLGFFLFRCIGVRAWMTGKSNPISYIGRHSLIIYMAHQPLIYGLLYAVFLIISRLP